MAKARQNTVKRQAEYRSEAGKMRTRVRQDTDKRQAEYRQEAGRIRTSDR